MCTPRALRISNLPSSRLTFLGYVQSFQSSKLLEHAIASGRCRLAYMNEGAPCCTVCLNGLSADLQKRHRAATAPDRMIQLTIFRASPCEMRALWQLMGLFSYSSHGSEKDQRQPWTGPDHTPDNLKCMSFAPDITTVVTTVAFGGGCGPLCAALPTQSRML